MRAKEPPPPPAIPSAPVPAVGVVCHDGDGRVLLIRRGNPPRAGEWSLPGGRVEWGERAVDAALRELHEETGLEGETLGLIDVVDGLFTSRRTGETTRHYVLIDYAVAIVGGALRAGDDATDARFFAPEELPALALWDETLRVIEAGRRLAGLKSGARAGRDTPTD
jgi:8-oxo-dGTP diphosphatase